MQVELQSTVEAVRVQRRSQRIKSNYERVLFVNDAGEVVRGSVFDESFGGIGLEFTEVMPVPIGVELQIGYNGLQLTGLVRHVSITDTDGCRIGIQWKADGLADQARKIVSTYEQAAATEESRDPAVEQRLRFLRLLPGGLHMMWKLFENGKWLELATTSERLAREASRYGIRSVRPVVDALQDAVARSVDAASMRPLLEKVVDRCLEACQANG